MKLITRDTDYAIRAVCYIAKQKEKIVAIPELVATLGVPQPFLRKILQLLNKKGILQSQKGQGGGFSLARPLNSISLLDLMVIFQDKFRLNECFLKKVTCPNTRYCSLRKEICKIEDSLERKLDKIRISGLLN